jgi:hypothetical protein
MAAHVLELLADCGFVDAFLEGLREGELPVDTMRDALSIVADYDPEAVARIACETLVQCSGVAAPNGR